MIIAEFLVLVVFFIVWARACRWLLAKALRRRPSLAVAHSVSLVSGLFLYGLLDAEGPFAGGVSKLAGIAALYVPAQTIAYLIEWYEQKRGSVRRLVDIPVMSRVMRLMPRRIATVQRCPATPA